VELQPIARRLVRRWKLLALGAVLAMAVAIAIGPPGLAPSYVAWSRVALDTPTSQLVDAAPSGADTLPWRASLLVHLMTRDEVRDEISDRLGIRSDDVTVVDPVLAEPQIQASMPKKAAEAAAVTVSPYVLTVELENSGLPMISVVAAAPHKEGATRLAEAAVDVLEEQSSQGGRYESLIAAQGAPGKLLQAFDVEQIADVRVKEVPPDALPVKAIGAAGFVLFAWTVAVLLAPSRQRRPLAEASA
jgi:hypothetical protein